MLILIFILICLTLNQRIHTILIFKDSKQIILPNYLQRTIWNSEQSYLPNLTQEVIQNNFTNYLKDIQIGYKKTNKEPKMQTIGKQLLITYELEQNILSLDEIIQEYDNLKQYYLTQELLILIHSNNNQTTLNNIYVGNNVEEIIKQYKYNLTEETSVNSQNQSLFFQLEVFIQDHFRCASFNDLIKNTNNYDDYYQIQHLLKHIEIQTRFFQSLIILDKENKANELFSLELEKAKQLLISQNTMCTQESLINLQDYQFSILSLSLVGYVVIKHINKLLKDDKNKVV